MTALEKSWNKENFAYFMEMGTGKTKVLIDNLAMLYDKGKVDGALIIAPKGVVKTWYEQELPAHLPDHIENVTILWQSNINKKQQARTKHTNKTAKHLLFYFIIFQLRQGFGQFWPAFLTGFGQFSGRCFG